MSIPVLTYHAMNITQNSYAGNDHLAFASDLQTIEALGLTVVPLETVVDWHEGRVADNKIKRSVAITFDDGSWFDYFDLDHPSCGIQRSMFNILRDHEERIGPGKPMHASSFVISSPAARTDLDRSCMIGKGWWGDEWWGQAEASGILSIECHSWDHAHPSLDKVAQSDNVKGDFTQIKTPGDCERQVTEAVRYIGQVTGRHPALYAYPWGQASDYLVRQFMPEQQDRHRLRAAFSIEPKHVTRQENTWYLPRYVCGRDWHSPDELKAILA